MASFPPLKITNVPGLFAQDLAETDPDSFDYIKSNFGLLDECLAILPASSGLDATPWERFKNAIAALNRGAPEGTSYRVLFLARHGQGYHNVALEYYGTPLWESHWARLDGDGTSVWADAKLTEVGIQEAKNANAAWKTQIKAGIPLPQSYYSSPMQRSANTLQITWSDITLDKKNPPKPVIKEKFRETLGIHTCDRRSTKSYLAETFPGFVFEEGFTEEDGLWVPNVRESNKQRNLRLEEALREVLKDDDSTYITISAHSGAITSMLEVIGHRAFGLQTGGVIPAVVKVEQAVAAHL